MIGYVCSHTWGSTTLERQSCSRGGRLLLLPFYWLTVVLIRAAGTAVGDFISGRNMLGLTVSTAVTGALFLVLLVIWREQSRSEREIAIAS